MTFAFDLTRQIFMALAFKFFLLTERGQQLRGIHCDEYAGAVNMFLGSRAFQASPNCHDFGLSKAKPVRHFRYWPMQCF